MDGLAAQNKKQIELIERWLAIVGGATLIGYAAKKRTAISGLLAILGGECVYCGITGASALLKAFGLNGQKWNGGNAAIPYHRWIRVDRSVIINRSPEEVYHFWRDLKKLPLFMKHVQSVRESWPNKTHWTVEGPAGTVQWDAEIITDKPGQTIAWKSLPGAVVDTAGSVHFTASGLSQSNNYQEGTVS